MPSSFAARIASAAFIFCSLSSPALAAPALDPANFDRAVSPTHDFYAFAVGGWVARNSIPADRTSWGAFDEVVRRNERQIQSILEASDETEAPLGTERRKLGDFYGACRDTAGIERAGLAALAPDLRAIASVVEVKQEIAGTNESVVVSVASIRLLRTIAQSLAAVGVRGNPVAV